MYKYTHRLMFSYSQGKSGTRCVRSVLYMNITCFYIYECVMCNMEFKNV